MNGREFWQLIDKIDRAVLEDGDEEEALRPLSDALESKSAEELKDFDELLSQKLYSLDGRQYAKNAGESGKSPDGFLYVRCYVVAMGRQFYLEIKSDPQKIPKTTNEWCESLLYVCQKVWASKTGQDISEWPFKASVSYETGSNEELWKD